MLALLASARTASAWTYHSFKYNYSIAIPDDWEQISEEILTVKAPSLPAIRSGKGSFDCALQPKKTGRPFEYPYILIEVIPYSGIGYQQQVNDGEIQTIVKANTGLDPTNPANAEGQVMEGGGELEALDGVLTFDRDGRRFVWSSSSSLDNLGLIRTRQWGFFGRDALVQITLYERGRGSDRLRDMARSMAASFKYEIGREYQPAFTFDEVYKMGRQFFAAPTMGTIVTAGCVGTALLFAVVALVSARRKLPDYDEYGGFAKSRANRAD
jgi:hypothetical protein